MKLFRAVVIPLALVLLLYLPFLGNEFVSDDIGGIVEVASRWTWLQAIHWPRAIHLGVTLQYWTYHLFGLAPWAFRLTNILFHMGNVFLVWILVQKLCKKPTISFIASLLFAIHPLAIESVTWISGGVYAQYTFFFLLSLILYIEKVGWKRFLSFMSFTLSLLISEKAVPLVFMFILYELMYGNIKKNWKRLIPYLLVSACFIFFYVSRISARLIDLEQASYQRFTGLYNPFLQVSIAISSYLELFIWPQALTMYHSMFQYELWQWVIRICVTVGFFGVVVYGIVKKRLFGFWLCWVIIGLGVTLLPFNIAWIVAERYVYVSIIGFCVVAGIIFDALLSIKRLYVVGVCVVMVVVLALCMRTIMRNNDWRTADSLWVATAIVSPKEALSWNNMGDVYARHGEFDKGIEAFTQATKLNDNFADAYHNIGNMYVQMKQFDKAIPFYKKALAIKPDLWQSYQELTVVAVGQKDYVQAIEYAQKAVTINPYDVKLWTNIGIVYLDVGEIEKSKYAMEQALQIDSANQQARTLQKRLQEAH